MQHKREIKTFARRVGKCLSDYQKDLLNNKLQNYEFKTFKDVNANNVLEIGFGNGGHLFAKAKQNPEAVFYGFEPYLNGVANLLKTIETSEPDINNIKICSNDFIEKMQDIPNNFFDKVYILFPDPWHKKKHHKRRIINSKFLDLVHKNIKPTGKLIIATDHDDYAEWIIEAIIDCDNFQINSSNINDFSQEPSDWVKTNYQLKAEKKGKGSYFFELKVN